PARTLLRALRRGVRRRKSGPGRRTQRGRAGPRSTTRAGRAVHGDRRGRGRADPRCRRRAAGALGRRAGAHRAPTRRGTGDGTRHGPSRPGSHGRRRRGAGAAPGAHRSAPRARGHAPRGHGVMGGLATAVERAWVPRTGSDRVLRALLVPASAAYGVAVAVRNALYDGGWLAVTRVPARVVSVGNLTVGGTGKTPAALWLADALSRRGRRVALVARGYRKRRPGGVGGGGDGGPVASPAGRGGGAGRHGRRVRSGAGPSPVGGGGRPRPGGVLAWRSTRWSSTMGPSTGRSRVMPIWSWPPPTGPRVGCCRPGRGASRSGRSREP